MSSGEHPSFAIPKEHLFDCLSTCLPFRSASIIQHFDYRELGLHWCVREGEGGTVP